MIVDCHTHINIAADGVETSAHFEASQAVDACIVLPAADGPSDDANKKVSDYVNRHKEKMIGFAVVEPTKDKTGTKNLAHLTDKMGLKGAVLYCSAAGFHPAHSRAMQFYESAQELRLPVFFHNSDEALRPKAVLDYVHPYLVDEIARTFPALKIVIGSMGVPFVEQTLALLAKHENVYADLTIQPSNVWQIYNIVVAAHERGVMDKLLFGSGFPYANAAQCMEKLLGFNMLFADMNLPSVPRVSIRNIIERNTLDLLGIEHSIKLQEHKVYLYAQ